MAATFRIRPSDGVSTTTKVMALMAHDPSDPGEGDLNGQAAPWLLGPEVLSNLPLQVALYFHAWFYVAWAATNVLMLGTLYTDMGLVTALYGALFVLEPCRLYLGYTGNLLERVSTLFAFWIITFLMELPIVAFLLLSPKTPVEVGLNIPLLGFLIFEVYWSYAAAVFVSRQQSVRYQSMFAEEHHLDRFIFRETRV